METSEPNDQSQSYDSSDDAQTSSEATVHASTSTSTSASTSAPTSASTEYSDECFELKNINYKTMLMTKKPIIVTKPTSHVENIDEFLENEKNSNKSDHWCKLSTTLKTQKITEFVDTYKMKNSMLDEDADKLLVFLKDCISRKKLYRVKDVNYDTSTGTINDIPVLIYNKTSRRFTLKKNDKRVSTIKSLPPKKKSAKTLDNKTKPNLEIHDP